LEAKHSISFLPVPNEIIIWDMVRSYDVSGEEVFDEGVIKSRVIEVAK
jgi:hypothetical protein